MSYYDDLLDDRWKKKRQKIIERDSHKCKNCNNNFLKEDFKREINGLSGSHNQKIIFIPFLSKGRICTYYDTEILSALSGGEFYVIYYDVIGDNHFSKVYGIQQLLCDKTSKESVLSFDDIEIKLKILGEKITRIRNNPDEYISSQEKKGQTRWSYVQGLHVHHTYYQYGLFAWEYPDASLETYCWKCHEEIHAETKIPCRDKNGNLMNYLTPCGRCSGAGYFPEYRHVQQGRCFECNGARYEELFRGSRAAANRRANKSGGENRKLKFRNPREVHRQGK